MRKLLVSVQQESICECFKASRINNSEEETKFISPTFGNRKNWVESLLGNETEECMRASLSPSPAARTWESLEVSCGGGEAWADEDGRRRGCRGDSGGGGKRRRRSEKFSEITSHPIYNEAGGHILHYLNIFIFFKNSNVGRFYKNKNKKCPIDAHCHRH